LYRLFLLAVAVCLAVSAGCDRSKAEAADAKPTVVASTTMLEDLTAEIGGDAVRVEGIMRPGGDPHLYQPSPGDARLIAESDLVVKSGLALEGWIDDLLDNAGGERPTVVASDGVEPIRMDEYKAGVDPHFWFDLSAWRIAAQNVGEALIELVGPDSAAAEEIEKRLEAHLEELDRLDAWVEQTLATIPEEHRVLVTSHDAFNYFGRAYDIDVVAIQGLSTDQEASQRDVANVIETVEERKAPAVFTESSVNPSLVKQVGRETGAEIAGPLYSDSIGASDGPASTFVGTVTENVRMITEALGGDFHPFEREDR
ncbi:MAG: metal ABC transporter solute-binding protein, Zn/Mn family, partial [Persicimonas sp.]